MSAKEMWFKIEYMERYEETPCTINIYYKQDEKEPIVSFLKNTKEIIITDIITLEELKAINKQIEELGWK